MKVLDEAKKAFKGYKQKQRDCLSYLYRRLTGLCQRDESKVLKKVKDAEEEVSWAVALNLLKWMKALPPNIKL